MVQANAAHADELQVLGSSQNISVDGGVNTHDQNVAVADLLSQLCCGQRSLGGLAFPLCLVEVLNIHLLAQGFLNAGVHIINNQALHCIRSFPI